MAVVVRASSSCSRQEGEATPPQVVAVRLDRMGVGESNMVLDVACYRQRDEKPLFYLIFVSADDRRRQNKRSVIVELLFQSFLFEFWRERAKSRLENPFGEPTSSKVNLTTYLHQHRFSLLLKIRTIIIMRDFDSGIDRLDAKGKKILVLGTK